MEGAAHAETYRALGAGFLEQRHGAFHAREDRKSTRLNSSHSSISYAVFCLKKKKNEDDKHKFRQLKPSVTRRTNSTILQQRRSSRPGRSLPSLRRICHRACPTPPSAIRLAL